MSKQFLPKFKIIIASKICKQVENFQVVRCTKGIRVIKNISFSTESVFRPYMTSRQKFLRKIWEQMWFTFLPSSKIINQISCFCYIWLAGIKFIKIKLPIYKRRQRTGKKKAYKETWQTWFINKQTRKKMEWSSINKSSGNPIQFGYFIKYLSPSISFWAL